MGHENDSKKQGRRKKLPEQGAEANLQSIKPQGTPAWQSLYQAIGQRIAKPSVSKDHLR